MYPKHAMVFVSGFVVGRLFDIGCYRIPFAGGSRPLVVLTCFLVPQCKVYWHFTLCQGFGVGVRSVTHWFRKRHGFALVLTGFEGAIGATFQPITLRQLIAKVGYARQSAGASDIVASQCMSRRLSPVKAPGSIPSSTVLTYIGSSAIAFEIFPNFAFYLVAIANFSSWVGRVTPGLLGDRFGEGFINNPNFPELRLTVHRSVNIITIMTAIAGAASIAWPFCCTVPKITGIFVL
ncbi:hypothetical protein B0H19DRAFT_969497 [Mycena capillaripes]|nr:hypothetical protein B0H19DRAFT_969497 [Mycena capillaripes]